MNGGVRHGGDEDDFCHDGYNVPQELIRALVGFQSSTLNKLDSEGRCSTPPEAR